MAPTMSLPAALSLLFSSFVASHSIPQALHPRNPDTCIVNTTSGLLRPLIDPSFPSVDQFLGIPFAAPPLGHLRFASPQTYRPSNPNAIFNATALPPSCPFAPTQEDIFDVYEPGFDYFGPQSEDCLQLDVYRPTGGKANLPVLIFVYGGGFVTGAANKVYQIPTPWVQDKQNLIVVAVQYRTNIFGFPNSAALTENNVGLEDVRFAVQWVKDNIAAFGGDVDRVTLSGHSAGSIATNAYTFAYPDNMLVSSTISMSGTVMTPTEGWQSHDYQHTNFTFVAHKLGCKGSDAELLACTRKQSTNAIANVAYNATNALAFKPIADNLLVFGNYSERLMTGNFAKQPAIIGNSRREGERSLDMGLSPAGPNQTEALAFTVIAFVCPSELVSKYRHAANVPTYRYELKANFTNISPLPWMGAYHGTPLPYLFGQTNNMAGHPKTGASTPFELEFSSHMQDLWQAFVADPESLASSWDWPLYQGGAVGEPTDAVKLLPGRGNQTLLSSVEFGAKREKYCEEIDPYLISQTLPPGIQGVIGGGVD